MLVTNLVTILVVLLCGGLLPKQVPKGLGGDSAEMETGDWTLETGGLLPKGLGGDSAEWKERGVKIEILDWRLEISRIEEKNLWQHHSL